MKNYFKYSFDVDRRTCWFKDLLYQSRKLYLDGDW